MASTRVLFGGIVTTFVCTALLYVPAQVHAQEELDLQRIQDGIDGCMSSDTPDGRLGCYKNLCEPSYRCAEAMLRAATKSGGPVLATTVLDDVLIGHVQYAIFSDGHELAHVIGRQLAKEFGSSGEAFMRCPSDYYYGCQHGFFEIVLANSPSPVDAAQSVCETAPEDQRFFCYHGVGHGFMMSYAYDLKSVLDKCNELPAAEFKRQGCWQGALMENINSYLRGESVEGVFDPKKPLEPCKSMATEYHWECYFNHASFLLRIHNHDIAKASAECMNADAPSRPACTRGLGQLAGNPGWQKIIIGDAKYTDESLVLHGVELCQLFPVGEHGNCITGMVENMLNYQRESDALKACSLLAEYEGQRSGCYRDVGAAMQRPTYPQERYVTYCPQFPEEYRASCDPDGSRLVPPPPENIVVRIFKAIGHFFSALWNGLTNLFAVSDTVPLLSNRPIPPAPSSSSSASTVFPSADVIIRFNNGKFLPAEVTIQRGESVTWANESEDPFWPASDNHPTHRLYQKGAFDPQKPILPGKSWSFTFDQIGDWRFHDHLYPTAVGTVHVK